MSREKWLVPRLSKAERELLWRRCDRRAGLDLALRLVVQAILTCVALELLQSGLWLIAVPFVIANAVVWTFMGWAGIGHELFHNTVFSNRQLNMFFFRVMSVLTWNNYAYFELSHWQHHTRTMWDDDPETRLECHIDPNDLLWLLSFNMPALLRRLRILISNAVGYVPSDLKTSLAKDDSSRRHLASGARTVIAVQVLLVSAFVLTSHYWLIVIICLAPFTFSLPVHALEVAQHCGKKRNVWDYRQNTRTIVLDPVLGFFYANMNYHVEHHMFPAIPYYNLPRARQLLIEKREVCERAPKGFRQALRVSLGTKGKVPGIE